MASVRSGSLQREKTPSVQERREDEAFKTSRYEETVPAKPPIPITVAPPHGPPTDIHLALRSPLSTGAEEDASKRDSGLAPTESTGPREGSISVIDERNSIIAPANDTVDPYPPNDLYVTDKKKSDDSTTTTVSSWKKNADQRAATPKTPDNDFSPITTPIPSDNQLDLDFMSDMSFSKRGSVLLGGKRVVIGHTRGSSRRLSNDYMMGGATGKVLSEEIEKESQKVRSLYETGLPFDRINGKLSSYAEGESKIDEPKSITSNDIATTSNMYLEPSLMDKRVSLIKTEHEMAGGIEDWEDVHGEDVDRYGFITLRKEPSRGGTPEPRAPQRVSTVLQMASETPRKRRGLGRTLSSSRSSKSVANRSSSRKLSPKSINTQTTTASKRSDNRPFRNAANRLPGNKDRRWMDEAGDMLTLPPGLADIAEDEEGGKAADSVKRKEWDRAEKWRKMAKIVKGGKEGEGMQFEFDLQNPKLIERTWKGIPDRWRATAWHSFLSASAKRTSGSATDSQIVDDFHRLLEQGSADDVQIDMDVPRTINSHIMFRKRYRGGQRLLFRVLHCLSLYFPDTGYVQGMASLAATLLCYYDEEKTFIMLVRMWQLRGLEKLYEEGFPGLTAALDEFQKNWIAGHAVTKKLNDLCIEPTAYGTRWYLTLFNYSIPFAAQLRVWDVFMLLGDVDPSTPSTKERPFQGGLDILHAASAALIDGTRDILLDSDFENAMKALTSWIPVKDEELFMKVAKVEWKLHHVRRRS